MAIAYKLYSRMTDMAEDLAVKHTNDAERKLVDFQDDIGWPFKASQDQLNDWNSRNWH